MTLIEFAKILDSSGINFARLVFSSEQKLPYGIYVDRDTDGLFANGKRVAEDLTVIVELYTTNDDLNTEKTLEKAFSDNDISYQKSDRIWFNDEKYMITYYKITLTYGKDDNK